MLLVLAIIFTAIIFSSATCPNGSLSSYTDPSTCYYFHLEKSNYMDAEGICIGLGGHLTSIHNMFENVFLSQKAMTLFTNDNDFWIGANDLFTEGKWAWIDNTPFEFTDWGNGEPKNSSDSDCTALTINGGKWVTTDCYIQKSFVCVTKYTLQQTTQQPIITSTKQNNNKNCDNDWTYYDKTKSCYKIFHQKNVSWDDAARRCIDDNSHLASIHSREENLFISDMTDQDNCRQFIYIGLWSYIYSTQWNWTDNTPVDYLTWQNDYNPTSDWYTFYGYFAYSLYCPDTPYCMSASADSSPNPYL